MSDRDPTKFTLWWTSTDCQASMWYGNYDSEKEAEAAIPEGKAELLEQCDPDTYDEGSWSVEPPAADDD